MGISTTKKRNPNIEWLRVIAMIMVVTLHALGKGDLLKSVTLNDNPNYIIAWIMESLSIFAVDLFALISGYFLIDSKYKSGRLLEIILQILFYGISILIVFILFGYKADTYTFIQCLLPLHMSTYWFMTSYVVMFLFAPVLSVGLKHMSQKQHLIVVISLVLFESLFKSILPLRLAEDEAGYSPLWFLILFVVASYFRLYGFRILNKAWKGIALYLFCATFVFVEFIIIDYISNHFGKLELLSRVSYDYNHIFVVLGAIGLLSWGICRPQKESIISRLGCFLAPMSLGVYLIHEHILIRYRWIEWLRIKTLIDDACILFVIKIVISILAVFIVCSIIDYFRITIFSIFKSFIFKFVKSNSISKIDSIMNELNE